MNKKQNIFIIDFILAFAGTLLYFFLFNFLVTNLSLPKNIVQAQLIANFVYGVYGLVIFVLGIQKLILFKFLVFMNFAYAGLCLLVGLRLLITFSNWGALLLLAEAILIAILANFERLYLLKLK